MTVGQTPASRGLVHTAILLPLALLLALMVTARPALAQDPDFGAVDDPLDGEYEIFTVDDLLIFQTATGSPSPSRVNNFLLETDNETITNQINRHLDGRDCYLTAGRQPQVTRVGRFFALQDDTIVTLQPTANAQGADCTASGALPNMGLYGGELTTSDTLFGSEFVMSAANTALAMDDFNRDGLDDLLVFSDAGVFVATAAVVTDTSQGMQFGPSTPFVTTTLAPLTDPTSGDFNGDGLTDAAWAAFDNTVHFATVCPGAIAGTVCASAAPLQVIVDPLQSRATVIDMPTSNISCSTSPKSRGVALTAGRFTTDGSDGLLTSHMGGGTGNCTAIIYWWEFDSDFSVIGGKEKSTIYLGIYEPLDFYAATARLDWFGATDQVVLAVGSKIYGSGCSGQNPSFRQETITVIWFQGNQMGTWSNDFNDTQCETSSDQYAQYPWVNGLAVGRFAAIPANPNTATDFNLQIATLRNDGKVHIYGVDAPTNYKPKLISTTTLDALPVIERPNQGGPNQLSWLVSGDLQGRSRRLGAPVVVRVNSHSQPSVILGVPPMHVDYILPDASTVTATQVINFTAAPDSYNSQYTVSDATDKQSSNTNTTSYSYAYSESAEEKFSLDVPLVSSISGDFKQAWGQKAESTSSNYQFMQNEFAFNAGTTTGFGDQVWFSNDDFNVYYYPVLGTSVVVTGTGGVTTTQPLYVSFSGPSDSVGVVPASGSTLEWYQPVHEPGQIFSYPWNKQQLEARYPGISLLTSGTPEPFYTDDSGTKETLNWSQNSGTSQTTGSSHTHSFETDNSITVGSIPKEGSGASVTGSFDYNNSTATSTLNTSSSTVGQSQGIDIDKPKFPTAYASLYQYLVQPFIFGRTPNAGTVQQLNLGTNITTTGSLRSAYVADPTDAQAGSWWTSDESPYTQYIDVALNHPQRWNITASSSASLACVVGDCAIPYSPLPDDLWNSQFYHMRGLLVTVGGTAGPQRAQATVGDDIFLQARVYNYSLRDMPAGSQIHVRFYRQAITGTTPSGASVLIAEKTANPLPGFNSAANPETPNWTTVEASFTATGDMAESNFIFWVVVWVEDQNGALVAELPGHGLTGLPGTLATIGDVPLEMTNITTAAGDQVLTSFSNNVGMFKQKFYIASSAAPQAMNGVLNLENAQVGAAPQLGRGLYLLTANIRASGSPAEAVEVLVYDRNPATVTSRVVDMDLLPFVGADATEAVSIPVKLSHCGANDLVIVARSGAANHSEQALRVYGDPCILHFPIIFNHGTFPQ